MASMLRLCFKNCEGVKGESIEIRVGQVVFQDCSGRASAGPFEGLGVRAAIENLEFLKTSRQMLSCPIRANERILCRS